ncbi:GntR family transcriptional regulator [Pseudarthrobacter sp. P1]|uniref:GntR family transcriptional regulator n=1 Tax=Pseudarthrobacter sp. P1 TaxID=3418418 RepID=UPI003CEF6464
MTEQQQQTVARTYKYVAVAAAIRHTIETSLSPFDAVPSERDLMALYGVSRMTVRQAIATLVDEGLVYNVHGSGTYVGAPDLVSKPPKLTSFTEDMAGRGLKASSQILALSLERADSAVALSLGLSPGSECTHIRRLRLADDKPMAIEDVYVPRTILDIEQFRLGESLYQQLGAAGYDVLRAEQTIQAITLDPEAGSLLGVAPNASALSVTRVSSSRHGQRIEFARTIYRADRYTFQLTVTRDAEK